MKLNLFYTNFGIITGERVNELKEYGMPVEAVELCQEDADTCPPQNNAAPGQIGNRVVMTADNAKERLEEELPFSQTGFVDNQSPVIAEEPADDLETMMGGSTPMEKAGDAAKGNLLVQQIMTSMEDEDELLRALSTYHKALLKAGQEDKANEVGNKLSMLLKMHEEKEQLLAGLAKQNSPSGMNEESMEEKAPPGMEDTVLALKKKYGHDSPRPFQIAWAQYNKKHGSAKEGIYEESCLPTSLKEVMFGDDDDTEASEDWKLMFKQIRMAAHNIQDDWPKTLDALVKKGYEAQKVMAMIRQTESLLDNITQDLQFSKDTNKARASLAKALAKHPLLKVWLPKELGGNWA